MLYGKVFRATVARGGIRAIDTSAAAVLAGDLGEVHNERAMTLRPSSGQRRRDTV
jgi:hypothetical protein